MNPPLASEISENGNRHGVELVPAEVDGATLKRGCSAPAEDVGDPAEGDKASLGEAVPGEPVAPGPPAEG